MIGKQLLSTSGLLALLCGALAMTCLAADRELTPESLAMPRWQIAFSRGGMIRLFNGRGGICIRDKTVTGLESLSFVPATLPGYRFGLAFREEGSADCCGTSSTTPRKVFCKRAACIRWA